MGPPINNHDPFHLCHYMKTALSFGWQTIFVGFSRSTIQRIDKNITQERDLPCLQNPRTDDAFSQAKIDAALTSAMRFTAAGRDGIKYSVIFHLGHEARVQLLKY